MCHRLHHPSIRKGNSELAEASDRHEQADSFPTGNASLVPARAMRPSRAQDTTAQRLRETRAAEASPTRVASYDIFVERPTTMSTSTRPAVPRAGPEVHPASLTRQQQAALTGGNKIVSRMTFLSRGEPPLRSFGCFENPPFSCNDTDFRPSLSRPHEPNEAMARPVLCSLPCLAQQPQNLTP